MKKILLIHGWNYDNYYGRISTNAWYNREKFINELKKSYDIRYPDLPGFGLEKEPNRKEYNLEDFADFIHEYIEKNNFHPDYILGYSFGGAVAVTYLEKYHDNTKLILVSPALIRNNYSSKKFSKTPKILDPIRKILRNFYLVHKVKVPEMVYGTKFLRNTYQIIVRVELIDKLEQIDSNKYIIIYGREDDMVDPNRMMNTVSDKVKKNIYFINGGGHDIANTHTKELVDIIEKFTK